MAKAAGKGVNLKDKLDGNELDLSLCGLNEVPVKELAAFPKATVLDLSCNKLTALPSDFCSLTHLVKLDLSKNQLQQLPNEFGRLVNLQHLDLLNNRLVNLPVSFCHLRNLKWLDLKDNPLDPILAKVAGDCLDEKQCKQCAAGVLQYLKIMQSDKDRERQRQLQAERELKKKLEAEQRTREAQERELRRREKAQEKERRRREYDALRTAQQVLEKKTEKRNQKNHKSSRPVQKSQQVHHGHSWLGILVRLVLCLLLCVLTSVVVCRVTALQHQPLCEGLNALCEHVLTMVQSHKIVQRVLQQTLQH
uniref:Leucine-rich repeat-containing protein 59 n=1 Tax=Geotrypetes seraphini TaxID=260995 RepID=A0A6P8SMQ8_GEOSA|nr:leucine-rich repeat-containing protein 59 [Geotrypetes seraphini]XP_033817609.1 leucine-rich repeat-containing protein 59 [Geotrypetes seraphini]